ncbi:MAG: methylated-DNA--[protein]-cysteine S-methyltransferase [bacterium]|nr:methylated-DNA--[protein]-cysteine S-methyltransferase [bacterium]
MYRSTITSPIGKLTLISDGEYLNGLFIENQKYFLENIRSELIEKDNLDIFIKTKKWIDEYFSGKNPEPSNLKLKPKGTLFQETVWQELLNIPYGKTTTYKELGKIVTKTMKKDKMSAQAIGNAVSHNPISIIIPCHRVIGINGGLTGYAGGLDKKEYLLKLEKNKGEACMIDKVGGVILKDKKILVQRKKNNREECMIPGGKREGNETDFETLKRELKEELDILLEESEYLGTYYDVAVFSNKPIKVATYLTKTSGKIKCRNEIKEAIWVDRNYKEQGIKLGSILKKYVIPELIKGNLM